MELSVVIPVYNEAENVRPLCEEVRASLAGCPFEIIFVDDASTDATGDELRALRAEYPEVRTLRHRQNAGQSAALLTGIRAAKADWIATLDGDGQNDPADIVTLLERRDAVGQAPPDMLAGHRQKREDTWIRRMSSRVANGVRSRLLQDDTPDTGCGLKLFRRELFLEFPHFNHMHRFMPALTRRAGGRVETVRVRHRPRQHGQSKYGLFDRLWVGIVDLFGVMWLRSRPCHVGSEEQTQ